MARIIATCDRENTGLRSPEFLQLRRCALKVGYFSYSHLCVFAPKDARSIQLDQSGFQQCAQLTPGACDVGERKFI